MVMVMLDDNDLERFVEPFESHLDEALAEIGRGRKHAHWMWFMFPQLDTLGRTEIARRYGLRDVAEARRFLDHPKLGPGFIRLVEVVHSQVVDHRASINAIFGFPDDRKLVSSLTLFGKVAVERNTAEMTVLAARCEAILAAARQAGLPRCEVTESRIASEGR